ncbi:hypothetical protein SAMD00019534_080470 [Acytostelium subglobosum LB1]|uniref:hypothetical protein n=1 Tax=Acytostelium subglobosum LB1 TaxID=1410327 RepID=UPI00064493BD|nr:hypothetical protein SAMD00019534_080470 [Acytostelium subglobosum LB1]GAM24872.1 hypothetical protein SAMD00019534_080470 [Acytostelium subglobosum LB1]|eukprot:XP_012751961.1 hypothetical protein SAMD00019534_080470 [Acytostelium subglobosum LB1]
MVGHRCYGPPGRFDRYYYIDDEHWQEEVLAMKNVGSITLRECSIVPFNKMFWTEIGTFMAEMSSRSVDLWMVLLAESGEDAPPQLEHLPLSTILLELKGAHEYGAERVWFARLPRTLKRLDLKGIVVMDLFDAGVMDLPSCQTIKGWSKSLPSSNTLPVNLKEISFSDNFTGPISSNNLPPQLESITLGMGVRHPLINLPASVTKLSLPHGYEQQINHAPLLSLIYKRGPSVPDLVCPSLTSLECESVGIKELSRIHSAAFPKLTTLKLGRIDEDCWRGPLDLSTLPSTLRHLEISACGPITGLPSELDTLMMSCTEEFRITSSSTLPQSLRSLSMHQYAHALMSGDIPSNLVSLCLTLCRHCPHPGVLPTSLRRLEQYRAEPPDHLADILACTTLIDINLHGRNHGGLLELRRINQSLFLNYSVHLPNFGFIDTNAILSKYKVAKH